MSFRFGSKPSEKFEVKMSTPDLNSGLVLISKIRKSGLFQISKIRKSGLLQIFKNKEIWTSPDLPK